MIVGSTSAAQLMDCNVSATLLVPYHEAPTDIRCGNAKGTFISKVLKRSVSHLAGRQLFSHLNKEYGRRTMQTTAGPLFPEQALPTKSGYLPVSDTSLSQLYYLFYEATESLKSLSETPWLLWLNGGPGCSSLIGCFYELGPWRICEDGSLQANEGTWNHRCGLLFIDNPIGTGFSIAASDDDVPKDQLAVASHLYFALSYFLKENPSFKSRPLFLAGESYAGKYIPALTYYMLGQVSDGGNISLRSQLAGIAIGNGLTDPRTQVQVHADVAHSFGLLDKKQRLCVHRLASDVVKLIDREDWLKAHEKRTLLCSWIEKTSGVPTLLDIRRSSKYHHLQDGTEYLATFLNSVAVKTRLRVDANALEWVSCRQKIRDLMAQDTMKSVKWILEAVLKEGIPVLLYQGMYDIKDGVAGSEAWMRSLKWDGTQAFWEADRTVWRENGVLVGYWRCLKNLTHVVFVGAGHQVPADQPVSSQNMIEKWMKLCLKPRSCAKL